MLRTEQLTQLDGLPNHWRYALTGGGDNAKRCFEPGWNERGNGHRLEEVIRLNTTATAGERWVADKCKGVGVITGEESNGLLVIDFDGVGSQSVRAFKAHFRHCPSELPQTLVSLSGKPGRGKAFFQVAPHWWPQLENRSASWRSGDGSVVLEAIWANGTGKGRHACIVGDHPDSSPQRPLFYRWAEKLSPETCGVAEAPEWLLMGVLAQMENSGERTHAEALRAGENDATPWERLSCVDRMALVELALPFCPNRKSRGSGTYEQVRRILAGLLNEFGLQAAAALAAGSEWDRGNEWEGTDVEKTLASLAKSKVAKDHQAKIATVFHFAREGGFVPPPWASPPIEAKVQVENIKKLCNQIIVHADDPQAVAMFLGRGRKEFGIEPETLRRLSLEQYLGALERSRNKTLQKAVSDAQAVNQEGDVLDGFLGRRVHILAGASHSGKTTLASFFVNRVALGLPIDIDGTRYGIQRAGKVLIFTSDCSDLDMVRDLALEGVTMETVEDRVRLSSGMTFDNMLQIIAMLNDVQPDLVVYDCLSSMAPSDCKIGEPAYADPIRLLVRYNGIAWPRCAHLILHHTTRDEPARWSGTEQIKASAEELMLYYAPELLKWRKGQPRPSVGSTRHLVFEKSRSGLAGKTITVTRNAYQGYWQLQHMNPEGLPALEKLASKFRAVLHDDWRIASQWQKELELQYNSRTLRRYLDQLCHSMLECEKRRSTVTGRLDTHYRPRKGVRDAAKAMLRKAGDGVNDI